MTFWDFADKNQPSALFIVSVLLLIIVRAFSTFRIRYVTLKVDDNGSTTRSVVKVDFHHHDDDNQDSGGAAKSSAAN